MKKIQHTYIAPKLGWKSLDGDSLCVSSFYGVGTSEIVVDSTDPNYDDWGYD